MNVLRLTACRFIRTMSTGRNRPMLIECEEDISGEGFETVVKLRGREMTTATQITELVAAQLADDLGIDVPQAAVVAVPEGFDAAVPDLEAAAALLASTGLNFGSVHLGPDFTTWPPERSPHGHHRDRAVSVFAFDALVQNPDRTGANPNLLASSDRLAVYDHEQAFSFLLLPIIGGAAKPWNAGDHAAATFRFLERHIFYSLLRGTEFSLDDFEERLGGLGDPIGYAEAVPPGWRAGNDLCEKMADYLREAQDERIKLINFIKHLLR